MLENITVGDVTSETMVWNRDSRYPGMRVTVRVDVSVRDMLAYLEPQPDVELARKMDEHVLEAWNLVDGDGKEIASLLDIEPARFREIYRRWCNVVQGISDPLGKPSNSGAT